MKVKGQRFIVDKIGSLFIVIDTKNGSRITVATCQDEDKARVIAVALNVMEPTESFDEKKKAFDEKKKAFDAFSDKVMAMMEEHGFDGGTFFGFVKTSDEREICSSFGRRMNFPRDVSAVTIILRHMLKSAGDNLKPHEKKLLELMIDSLPVEVRGVTETEPV